jgi:N-acetylglutamate synthase-like GNAT family acetyltransferase
VTDFAVREAQIGDAEAIANLVMRSWRAAYPGMVEQRVLDDLSLPEQTAKWTALLEGSMTVLVAEQRGSLAGVIAIAKPSRDPDEWTDVAELVAVYADPDKFRSGAGAALMTAALTRLREAQASAITVWTLNNNTRALAFYEQFGFKRDGKSRDETDWHEPDVRLRRALP